MKKTEIVEFALENLENETGIRGAWAPEYLRYYDGTLVLLIDNENIAFKVEVKNELRTHMLEKIFKVAGENEPFMVVANRIFPALKAQLRNQNIAYLETNGNIWLNTPNKTIWIETKKPGPILNPETNRAFGVAGLKVIFHFLLKEELINLPYRDIAKYTGVALGSINYIFNGLRKEKFLIPLNKNEYKLTRKRELLERWIEHFHHRLLPACKVGAFRFIHIEQLLKWKDIEVEKGKTYWGGEAAGDLLTDYLNAANLTLYTLESKKDLITKMKIIPAEEPHLMIYKVFWNTELAQAHTVPPLLAYAELIYSNDHRVQETAQKIYDAYLQNQF